MDTVMGDVMTPVVDNRKSYGANSGSLHSALRPVIILAQCFGMFPLNGITAPDASHLKFTWRSFRMFYSILATLAFMTFTFYSIHRLATTNLTSTKTSNVLFYAASALSSILFIKLAKDWPHFATTWERMERDFSPRHLKNDAKFNLTQRFKVVSGAIMILAFVEHGLSLISGATNASKCSAIRSQPDFFEIFFFLQFPQLFSMVPYSFWKGVIAQFANLLSTFSWNFIDLFLILISDALTEQFRQLNKRLYAIRGKRTFTVKTMPDWWWTEARMDFNRLANLTRRVDSLLSRVVFLSFSANLYFICIQLLNSFKLMANTLQTIYFCFSFGFLLTRTAAVSLFAAAIHDESALPAPVLYSVSGNNYSPDVNRFLTQVTTDSISLTGMKFFSVTRSLVLTVAGTIVTYELILIQFNTVQQVEPSNVTLGCDLT